MATTKDIVEKFINLCQELGWTFGVGGRANSILTIYKEIEKDSLEDFVQADSEYNRILTTIPRTSPGSTWGTDGGGVGAVTAMKTGLFTMKMSGGSRRILGALARRQ